MEGEDRFFRILYFFVIILLVTDFLDINITNSFAGTSFDDNYCSLPKKSLSGCMVRVLDCESFVPGFESLLLHRLSQYHNGPKKKGTQEPPMKPNLTENELSYTQLS